MKLEDFKSTLSDETPPSGISSPLQAMWYDAKGDWESAHQTVQNETGKAGAWVHAYLHRKEGDAFNARYWYAQARRKKSNDSFESEWEQIVGQLLQQQ